MSASLPGPEPVAVLPGAVPAAAVLPEAAPSSGSPSLDELDDLASRVASGIGLADAAELGASVDDPVARLELEHEHEP